MYAVKDPLDKPPRVDKRVVELAVALAFYFVLFGGLSFPLLLSFSTGFFADGGDGLQNVWNIWWVDQAVRVLHQSPWYTFDLHYPYGVSLLGQTLNPFNGFVGVILLRFLTLVQTFNVIVIFGFVVGGFNAFLLCRHLTRSYWPSLIGGAVFTFSNYHFAHAQGHLQLVSLEWIPLFILLWHLLLERPSIRLGIGTGATLFAVLLCDYYYFTYCVMAGAIMMLWQLSQKRKLSEIWNTRYARGLAAFTVTVLITCGPLIAALLLLNARDPLTGAHQESEFSLDLASLIIPGGHWRFAGLTKFFWARLPGNINESSVDLGVSVIALLVYTWLNRRRLRGSSLSLWYILAGIFALLSLGPCLHVWGRELPVPLPYLLLDAVFPPLRLSGTPVRMVVMVFLSASIIVAFGFKLLLTGTRFTRVVAGLCVLAITFEYLPTQIPVTTMHLPAYVTFLAKQPGHGAVLDLVSPPPSALYYQTIYNKPMAFGYVSRLPESVVRKDAKLRAYAKQDNYAVLCHEYHIRYVVQPDKSVLDIAPRGACAYQEDATAQARDSRANESAPKLKDGTFVKGSGPTIYLMKDGLRDPVTDWETFQRLGGATDLSNVTVLPDVRLAAIPLGPPATASTCPCMSSPHLSISPLDRILTGAAHRISPMVERRTAPPRSFALQRSRL